MFKQPENIPPVTMRARISFEKGDSSWRLAYRKSGNCASKKRMEAGRRGRTAIRARVYRAIKITTRLETLLSRVINDVADVRQIFKWHFYPRLLSGGRISTGRGRRRIRIGRERCLCIEDIKLYMLYFGYSRKVARNLCATDTLERRTIVIPRFSYVLQLSF